jgi:hypothetical protein
LISFVLKILLKMLLVVMEKFREYYGVVFTSIRSLVREEQKHLSGSKDNPLLSREFLMKIQNNSVI